MRSDFQAAGTSSSNSPNTHSSKAAYLSTVFVSPLSIFEAHKGGALSEKRVSGSRSNGLVTAIKRVMNSGSMRRIKEHVLGYNKTNYITSNSDIWLLGVCYKPSSEDSPHGNIVSSSGFVAFVEDFSSRILLTYRKGFDPIGDSKYTSDSGWGCMLRSSQMLVAQALVVHQLGRSWRKSVNKELSEDYIAILHLFGDSEESFLSIHNLINAGRAYGLAAGSWVGPYAMCRTWETLVRGRKVGNSLSLTFYIVSGDEDGERGGAPVLCVEDVYRHCTDHAKNEGGVEWSPVILLVPLVLGLDKVNPRYVPLLAATFTFPQSLGILGGKPGASTYITGVQDGQAFYLDPHEAQPVAKIKTDDLEADSSSYHCNVVRHFPLESVDPSLAIGFYCRDKEDFDDLCLRASKLVDESKGAPLFTVACTLNSHKSKNQSEAVTSTGDVGEFDSCDMIMASDDAKEHEDDWQLL
ncbi:hypothetical protein V2J09_019373 [Rumex salicifolius]